MRGIGRQPPTQLVGRWSRRRSSDQPSVSARTDVRQKLPGSRPPVSSLSAAIPYATSRRIAVPGSVTLVSRVDVVPCKAATDLAKGRAWPDTEEVTGSNPVAPTRYRRWSGRVWRPRPLPSSAHRLGVGQHKGSNHMPRASPKAVVTEDGPHPRVELGTVAARSELVVLAGRATRMP